MSPNPGRWPIFQKPKSILPSVSQLKELIEHARNNGINIIFVQFQFSTKCARLVAGEIGGQVVFADPLAEDWLDNLSKVANKFRGALK